MSGKANGKLWANAQASASLIENWVPGVVGGQGDPRNVVYVVDKSDPPFSQSWIDWADAVALGADYYDGNGNGVYDPIDLDGNGVWDPTEDMPDLIGDQVAWSVYNDGQPVGNRTNGFPGIAPQGIEVRQSVFGFASKGIIGNIIFVRYRFKNTGTVADVMDSVYFGVWADPDLGTPTDDYVGCDIDRNAGYVYNLQKDDRYGSQTPCFLIDFFSGPGVYVPGVSFTDVNENGIYDEGTDIAVDTAFTVKGQLKGVDVFPGATNLGLSSFVQYIQGDEDLRDPHEASEARHYMLGLNRVGQEIDPCNWAYGVVKGVDCTTLDNKFWYSGDPVKQTGWLVADGGDQRQMQNIGPFQLLKDEEVEVTVAYIVGQGASSVLSVDKAKSTSDGAQFIFDHNYLSPSPPPAVKPRIVGGDNYIDIYWDTPEQVNYHSLTDAWDLKFQGYNVYTYKTNSTIETIDDHPNVKLYKTYSLNNEVKNIFKENPETGGLDPLYAEGENKLDSALYSDPETGRIRLRITNDPNTGDELIKGKEYYFAITGYALNYMGLKYKTDPADTEVDPTKGILKDGDYYLSIDAFTAEAENIPKVFKVTFGEDMYTRIEENTRITGENSKIVEYDIIDKSALTGDEYQVNFFPDSTSEKYLPYWKITNLTNGNVLLDSAQYYSFGHNDSISAEITDGFILRISKEDPSVDTMKFVSTNTWYDKEMVKFYYPGTDIDQDNAEIKGITNSLAGLNSTFIKGDRLRNVEIRFNESGKAYRYLAGYIGSKISSKNSTVYAEAVTEADTTGKGIVGKLGQGFVDVPFTAWVKDDEYGETRQLAVGFIEKSKSLGGNPDGVWEPDTNVFVSGEYILIFDEDYDHSGNNTILKGGFPDGAKTIWAELRGGKYYPVPESANLSYRDRQVAKSPFLNTLYVVDLSRSKGAILDYSGSIVSLPVAKYPFTPADVIKFKTVLKGEITSADKKALFDKVTVYPNPLFGFNVATSYDNSNTDEPFVTFSNLPDDISIKIFSLSGNLLRTLNSDDKSSPTSPFLRWDLKNESGLRVASGMYIAIVTSPEYGDKVLKFAIIMPQKQIPKY